MRPEQAQSAFKANLQLTRRVQVMPVTVTGPCTCTGPYSHVPCLSESVSSLLLSGMH
jgi:hypothetical protein